MRHAFLIIAHNEFAVLKRLILALDNVRNDIYVHIDGKVKVLPELAVEKSRLIILDRRMDVRWGHYSQISTELLLFESALKNGPYEYYHLISGTHLPLKSQEEIYTFYKALHGKNLFSNLHKTNLNSQEILKLHRVNLFLRDYASPVKVRAKVCQWMWKAVIAVQRTLKLTINDGVEFYWANNWCSLSEDAVSYLVARKKNIQHRYRWSFCGDEFFVPTELMQSELANNVVSVDKLLYCSIGRSNASVLTMDDIDDLMVSDCLFGRKFTGDNKQLMDLVLRRQND